MPINIYQLSNLYNNYINIYYFNNTSIHNYQLSNLYNYTNIYYFNNTSIHNCDPIFISMIFYNTFLSLNLFKILFICYIYIYF